MLSRRLSVPGFIAFCLGAVIMCSFGFSSTTFNFLFVFGEHQLLVKILIGNIRHRHVGWTRCFAKFLLTTPWSSPWKITWMKCRCCKENEETRMCSTHCVDRFVCQGVWILLLRAGAVWARESGATGAPWTPAARTSRASLGTRSSGVSIVVETNQKLLTDTLNIVCFSLSLTFNYVSHTEPARSSCTTEILSAPFLSQLNH